jgi:hypothetical protein
MILGGLGMLPSIYPKRSCPLKYGTIYAFQGRKLSWLSLTMTTESKEMTEGWVGVVGEFQEEIFRC